MPGETSGLRLGVMALVVLSLFAALFGRLWFLQVAAPPDLAQQVFSRKIRTVQLNPMRGRILDRQGRILADNKRVLNIVVDRKAIRRDSVRLAMFDRIQGVLDIGAETLEKKYKDETLDPLLPLTLATDVSEAQAGFVRERLENYVGVQVEETWARVYRYAPLASHIVGFLGRINKGEIETLVKQKGYLRSDLVGRSGIEQQFEDVLRGKPGFQKFEINAAGQPVAQLDGAENRQDPVPGNDVQLTIDLDVQQYAEQILDAELRKRRRERPSRDLDSNLQPRGPIKPTFGAPAGSMVVLDPNDGRVVALASNPPYDNRWFTQPLPDAKVKQLFGDGTHNPLLNRTIQGQYQIGSTMKLFTTTAALNNGIINPGDRPKVENSRGKYEIPNCEQGEPSGCERQNSGGFRYGSPDLYEALTVSSDAYFYNLGALLYEQNPKGDLLQNTLRGFGFDKASGIALPDDQAGYVPDRALKKKFATPDKNGKRVISAREGESYFIGDNINLAIGQGLLAVTPIQLANAYATFANGGTLHAPQIALKIYAAGAPRVVDHSERVDLAKATVVQEFEPVVRGTVEMPEARDSVILPAMKGVTQAGPGGPNWICTPGLGLCRDGTAVAPFSGYDWEAYPVYGKTGTAQDVKKDSWKDTSLFSAFGGPPDQPPQYQVTSILEESGFGSGAAALTVRCMFEKLANPKLLAPVNESDILNRDQFRAAVLPKLSEDDQTCLHVEDELIRSAALGPVGKID